MKVKKIFFCVFFIFNLSYFLFYLRRALEDEKETAQSRKPIDV